MPALVAIPSHDRVVPAGSAEPLAAKLPDATVIRPSAGRRSPLRCFTSVVLPEPFWPRIATDSPGSMVSETPRTASMPLG